MPPTRSNWFFGIVSLASALFYAPSFGQQNGTPALLSNGRFSVAGVVVSAKTGAPLAQARIALVNTKNPREAVSMITQENGHFEFTGLSAGKYSLEGARRGYLPAAYQQHEQFSTAIVTGEDFDTKNLTLRLIPMASLTGKVLDENGECVRNANVRLFVESHRGGSTRVTGAGGAMTDDQGTFEFAPLGPGKFYVAVTASTWYAFHVSPSGTGASAGPAGSVDASLDAAYPTTFFGGSTESDGAEPITISGGDQAQIDIHVSPVPSLHLLFHVPDNGQHGFRMPFIEKRVFDQPEYVPTSGTQGSSSPGVFEISGVPAGKYSIRMPGDSGQMQQGTEVNLSEDHQDLDEMKGEPTSRVKLSVKMPGNETIPKSMNVSLQDTQNKVVSGAQVDANVEATFNDLSAGKYSIRVFTPAKAYSVVRMSSGDTQISGHDFSLTSGLSQEWTVFLAAGNTRIEGFVKRSGKPASGIMVVLIPKDPETHQDLFRRDQSDLDGSFVLLGVIPGSYTVVAIDDAWGFDWSKPTLLSHYAEHGSALTIGDLIQGAVHLPDPIEVQPR
jgi:hypothetical protein